MAAGSLPRPVPRTPKPRTYIYDARTGKEYWHIDAGPESMPFPTPGEKRRRMDVFLLLKDWAALTLVDLAARKLVWRQEYPPIDPTLSPYSAWLADDHRLILARRSARDQRMNVVLLDLLTRRLLPGGYKAACAVDRPFLLRMDSIFGSVRGKITTCMRFGTPCPAISCGASLPALPSFSPWMESA